MNALQKKEPFEVIHYVVMVETPLNIVSSQLAAWFENDWRSSSKLKFKTISSGGMRAGSKFRVHFNSFWPVNWRAEIARFDANESLQSLVSGFFKGTETVSIEERFNGIKVDYRLEYEIRNPLSQMVWSVLLEDQFVQEVRKAMEAFKKYCEKRK